MSSATCWRSFEKQVRLCALVMHAWSTYQFGIQMPSTLLICTVFNAGWLLEWCCLYFPFEPNEPVLWNGSKAPENVLRNIILKKKKISFLPRKSVFPFYKFGVYLVTAVSREAFSLDAAFFSSNLGFPQEAGVFLLVQCYTTENVNSCQSACFCSLLSLSHKLLGVLVGFIHGKFLLSS